MMKRYSGIVAWLLGLFLLAILITLFCNSVTYSFIMAIAYRGRAYGGTNFDYLAHDFTGSFFGLPLELLEEGLVKPELYVCYIVPCVIVFLVFAGLSRWISRD